MRAETELRQGEQLMAGTRDLAQRAYRTFRIGGSKTFLSKMLSFLETRWLLVYHRALAALPLHNSRDLAAIRIVKKQSGDEDSLRMLEYLVPQLNRIKTIDTPTVVLPNYLFFAFSLAGPIIAKGRLRLIRMDQKPISPDVFVCNRSMMKQVSPTYADLIKTFEVVFENNTYVVMATPSLLAPSNSNCPMSSEQYVRVISSNQTGCSLARIRKYGLTFVIRNGTVDEGIIDEVNDEYIRKLQEDRFFGQNVIDLGAHIGAFSLQVTRFLKEEDAKVISVEPSPYNYELLRENIRLNHLQHIVRAVRRLGAC